MLLHFSTCLAFGRSLLRLGEVRSLHPQNVKELAMNATVSRSIQVEVSGTIGLVNPLVIAVSLCKSSIVCFVSQLVYFHYIC